MLDGIVVLETGCLNIRRTRQRVIVSLSVSETSPFLVFVCTLVSWWLKVYFKFATLIEIRSLGLAQHEMKEFHLCILYKIKSISNAFYFSQMNGFCTLCAENQLLRFGFIQTCQNEVNINVWKGAIPLWNKHKTWFLCVRFRFWITKTYF